MISVNLHKIWKFWWILQWKPILICINVHSLFSSRSCRFRISSWGSLVLNVDRSVDSRVRSELGVSGVWLSKRLCRLVCFWKSCHVRVRSSVLNWRVYLLQKSLDRSALVSSNRLSCNMLARHWVSCRNSSAPGIVLLSVICPLLMLNLSILLSKLWIVVVSSAKGVSWEVISLGSRLRLGRLRKRILISLIVNKPESLFSLADS